MRSGWCKILCPLLRLFEAASKGQDSPKDSKRHMKLIFQLLKITSILNQRKQSLKCEFPFPRTTRPLNSIVKNTINIYWSTKSKKKDCANIIAPLLHKLGAKPIILQWSAAGCVNIRSVISSPASLKVSDKEEAALLSHWEEIDFLSKQSQWSLKPDYNTWLLTLGLLTKSPPSTYLSVHIGIRICSFIFCSCNINGIDSKAESLIDVWLWYSIHILSGELFFMWD